MTVTVKNARAGRVKTISLVIALAGCGSFYGLLHVHHVDSRTAFMTPAILTRAASALNATLPKTVSTNTEWMRATAVGATLFRYDYRLANVTIEELAPTVELRETYLEEIATETSARARHTACTTPETRDVFLGRGVTMRYRYFDRNDAYLFVADVTPTDCGLAIRA